MFTLSSLPAGNSTPEETVALLVRAGLFDTAITLCQTFKLPLTPVFEGLTFKYVTSCFSSPSRVTRGYGDARCVMLGRAQLAAPRGQKPALSRPLCSPRPLTPCPASATAGLAVRRWNLTLHT